MYTNLNVPPNTPIARPVSFTLPFMDALVIRHERIDIPKGHAFLTGIQLYAGGRVLRFLPEAGSGNEWIQGDGITYERYIPFHLEPPRFYIEIRAYNLDAVYTHSFYINLE